MKNLLCLAMIGLCGLSLASWSTLQGDNQRTGRTSLVLPTAPHVKWQADLLGKPITSPVVGPNGTIFIGPVLTKEKKPRQLFHAINPDGTIKWRFALPALEDQTMGTPAVDAQNRVYFGTPHGKFYALDTNGNLLWTYDAGEQIWTDVLVGGDGNIYAKLGGRLFSFTPGGAVRWQVNLGYPDYRSWVTETLSGDILCPGTDGTYCFSRAGTQKWTTPVYPLGAATVAPDGRIILQRTEFWWVSPVDGSLLQFSAGAYLYGTYCSPAVDLSGNVYFPYGGYLLKYNSLGAELVNNYNYPPGSNRIADCIGSPIIDANNRVFMGMGGLYRTDLDYEKSFLIMNSSLVRIRTVPLGQIAGSCSPAVANNGDILIATLDGKLNAIGN